MSTFRYGSVKVIERVFGVITRFAALEHSRTSYEPCFLTGARELRYDCEVAGPFSDRTVTFEI